MSGRALSKVPWFPALVHMMRKGGTTVITDKDVTKLLAKLEYPLALHLEIYAFLVTAELTPQRIALRDETIDTLERTIRATSPDVRLVAHGSHATGMAHHFSDVNLIAKKVNDAAVSRALLIQIIERSRAFKLMKVTTERHYLSNHDVIQIENTEGQLIVRISVIEDHFLKRTKWVTRVLQELPEVRPLYMMVKALMTSADFPPEGSSHHTSAADLGEPLIKYRSRIPSWLLLCLVVAFCRRCRENRTVRNLLGDILLAFLHTYANFNYSEFVIDPNSSNGISARCTITPPLSQQPVHVLDPVTHMPVEHDIDGPEELKNFRVFLDALLKLLIATPILRHKQLGSMLAPALSMEVFDVKTRPKHHPSPLDTGGYAIFRPYAVAKCTSAHQ